MASDAPLKPSWLVAVYLDDGLVFEYEVRSAAQAREHAGAIMTGGYRSVSADAPAIATFYPPHRLRKVKVTGPEAFPSVYPDRVRAT